MITLTTEQAQQIEKSLSGWKEYDAWTDQQMWNNDDEKALVTIREARAQEQAEQEPIMRKTTRDEKIVRPGVYEVSVEQAEQEPVGVIGWAANIPNTMEEVHWEDECPPIGTTLYAAPVRTKDLTDDELREIMKQPFNQREYLEQFARAVIAADREKNK